MSFVALADFLESKAALRVKQVDSKDHPAPARDILHQIL